MTQDIGGRARDGLAVGVDLGGTNLRAGVVRFREGVPHVLSLERADTPTGRAPEVVASAIGELVGRAVEAAQVAEDDLLGVGLGIPGLLRRSDGLSLLSPNFGWRDVPFGTLLKAELRGSLALDNDVRVYTRGEWAYGAGRRSPDAMCVTLGTGVGSGLISGGRLIYGPLGAAGEVGHIVVDPKGSPCGCGKRGCVETYASASGVLRMARGCFSGTPDENVLSRLKVFADSSSEQALEFFQARLSEGPLPLSARGVAAAAEAGDLVARAILDRAADALAIGLSAAVNLLNLSLIVVGGGMSEAGASLFDPLLQYLRLYSMPVQAAHVQVVKAKLGDEAAIVGGAHMVAAEEDRL